MSVNRFDTRPLDFDGCLDRLRSTRFGRVSIVQDGLPFVLPVTFRLGDERLVIHTVGEDDVVPLTRDRMVVFEADSFSAAGGWSVNVIGFANAAEARPHRLSGRRSDGFADDGPLVVEIPFDMVVGRLIVPEVAQIDLSSGSPFQVMDRVRPPSIAS